MQMILNLSYPTIQGIIWYWYNSRLIDYYILIHRWYLYIYFGYIFINFVFLVYNS